MTTFFTSRLWKVFVVTFSISAPIFILSVFHEFFLLIVMAFALTMVLKPIVDALENKGFPRPAAILGLYVVIGSVFALGLLTIYPVVVAQIMTISAGLDSRHLTLMFQKLGGSIASVAPFIRPESVAGTLSEMLAEFARNAQGILTSIIAIVASLIIVPLITFFLLNDYDRFGKALIEAVPNKYFEMALNVVNKLERQLSRYIRGVVIETLIVGVLYTIAYYILGIRYATVLGILGGISNIIPLVGPIIGAVPVILVTIIQYGDLTMFIPVIVTVFAVQQIDEILVQPNVYGRILNMHPLTIILVILIGSELMGVIGMVLAIPIYTIISVTARETNWGLKNYRITH